MCEGAVQRVATPEPGSRIATPQQQSKAAGNTAMGYKASNGSKHRLSSPFFLTWRPTQTWRIVRTHPLLVLLTLNFVLVIPLEHTLKMVPQGGEPYDAGFVATEGFHRALKRNPDLHHLLAAANTALVLLQIVYIAYAWAVEGRFRPTLASAFMYSSRGFLGWSTQLPVPREFLGSRVDFPVGNASFFLFFSGHVGASVIATLDLRRVGRRRGALAMDAMNALQTARLLATRGHYTIDLASGAVAGWACYRLAEWYEDGMQALRAHAGGAGKSDGEKGLERKDSLVQTPEHS